MKCSRLGIGMMVVGVAALGCADDAPGTEADRVGVGAICQADTDCRPVEADTEPLQSCLVQFKGGYCGIEGCDGNEDCPDGAACVAHDDGVNYCFRRCLDKGECNINRTPDAESNCSANIVFVDDTTEGKACVPPPSG